MLTLVCLEVDKRGLGTPVLGLKRGTCRDLDQDAWLSCLPCCKTVYIFLTQNHGGNALPSQRRGLLLIWPRGGSGTRGPTDYIFRH